MIFNQKVSNADFIVNITNDTWFANSSGPYQHLKISQAQAIVCQKPLLRVANNGISAIINSNGQIIKKLGYNKKGVVDGFVPLN